MNTKIALVTGGTGGLGTAICHTLFHAGFHVIAGYHKNGDHAAAKKWQTEQCDKGYDIDLIHGDVSDYTSTQQMAANITANVGPVSVLVNNAGITHDTTLRKMSLTQWLNVINTNLNSVFNVTHAFIETMCAHGFGRIINISSINGQKGQGGQTNYCAAKAGIHGFTMALAQEVAKKGVTVNTISPGYIETSMLDTVPEKILDSIIANIPVGRLGKPEDIAQTVAFLASPHNQFITGANIPVNGGQYMS